MRSLAELVSSSLLASCKILANCARELKSQQNRATTQGSGGEPPRSYRRQIRTAHRQRRGDFVHKELNVSASYHHNRARRDQPPSDSAKPAAYTSSSLSVSAGAAPDRMPPETVSAILQRRA